MTLSQSDILKTAGLTGGVQEVADAMGTTRQTITNWFNSDSPMFWAAVDYAVKEKRRDTAAAMSVHANNNTPDHISVTCCVRDADVELTFRDSGSPVIHVERIPADLPTWGGRVAVAIRNARGVF